MLSGKISHVVLKLILNSDQSLALFRKKHPYRSTSYKNLQKK